MNDTQEETNSCNEWLDKKFVAVILSQKEGRPVTVHQLRVAPAVGKGENYASFLQRVGVDFAIEGSENETKSTSLIVKCLPLGEIMQMFLRECGAFQREGKMYSTTIPAMHAILDEIYTEKFCFCPKALRCERENTIVLEDLRDLGFRMSNRHSGMDLKHATLVLRNLARFHAASVALHARDPEQVESYTDIMYRSDKREQIDKFVPSTLEAVAKAVDSWERDDSKYTGYAERVRKFANKAVDKVIAAVQPSDSFLNALNHGDCWVNNSMFRYSEESGEIEDMRFIDFQITRYGSPSLDLQYFLYTSVQADVRENHWRQLLEGYVGHLSNTLRALGHADKMFTVDELQVEMDERGAFGLVSSCTVLCAVVADPSDALDLDGLTQEDLESGDVKMFDKAVSGDRFNQALKRLLPYFVEKGVL